MTGIIPLSAAKSQSLNVTLNSQTIRLDIMQKRTGLFMNVWQNGTLMVSNALCLTNTCIVRAAYMGLPGDFAFIDMQGDVDPDYTGLGSRWLLVFSEDFIPGKPIPTASDLPFWVVKTNDFGGDVA